MLYNKLKIILVTISISFAITSCGVKGDLYLPQDNIAQN